MRLRFRIPLLLLIATLASWASAADFREISWQPAKIVNGSPCLFLVRTPHVASEVKGEWQGKAISFVSPDGGKTWYALAGVDADAKPGPYKLAVVATESNGSRIQAERTVLVGSAQYPTERLRVPQKFVEPSPEDQAKIEADRQLKSAAFKHETTGAEWSGSFRPPVETSVSEGFGTRRTFNGKLASQHRGLDFHAPMGTPVTAANSGEVVLAQPLFYEGNCVIIDHGQQFMTIYMHLSQLEVREGQHVEKGQKIGLSGATGRATGPHLHMAARWQGAYVDPARLWALPLPELQAQDSPTTAR
jgi:murein DD-endopeptidase MepM/ murein hydrolase activator NlpD